VKRKWKIEKNNKEKVQFQTPCKATRVGVKKKRTRKELFPKVEKNIHLAAVQ